MACALVLVSRMEYWTVSPQVDQPVPVLVHDQLGALGRERHGRGGDGGVAEPELALIGSV